MDDVLRQDLQFEELADEADVCESSLSCVKLLFRLLFFLGL